MVSKSKATIKRTPPRSVKDRRNINTGSNRRRNKSPAKKAAATVIASINKSIVTCHRRLIKLFTKLARIATPNRSSAGYKILKKSSVAAVKRSLSFTDLLPPPDSAERRTVFLDLDETLVHSQSGPPPEKFDFAVHPRIGGEAMSFYVLKRPGVDEFLAALAASGFEVVIFTAGLREYASLVIDRLDRSRSVVAHRLYRDSCAEIEGRLVKDLSAAGRDLRRAVIVDDNPNSYSLQPRNAIPIKPFVDDLGDRELWRLAGLFKGFDAFEDMRDGVKDYLSRLDRVNVALDDDNNNTSQ